MDKNNLGITAWKKHLKKMGVKRRAADKAARKTRKAQRKG